MQLTVKSCRCCGGPSFRRLEQTVEVDRFFAHHGLQMHLEHSAVIPQLDWAMQRRISKLPGPWRRQAEKILSTIRKKVLLTSLKLSIPYGLCDDCRFLAPWFEVTDDQLQDYYAYYLKQEYKQARLAYQPHFAKIADIMGSAEENAIRRGSHSAYLLPHLERYRRARGKERLELLDYGGAEGGIQPEADWIDADVLDVGTEQPLTGGKELKRYDCVQCLHVLEHVGAPLRICRDAMSRCLPGGLLYVEVPVEFPGEEAIRNGQLPPCHEHLNKFCLTAVEKMLSALEGTLLTVEMGEVNFLHLEGLTPVIRGLVQKSL